MRTTFLTLVAVLFSGMVWGQEKSNDNKNKEIPTLIFNFVDKKFSNKDEFDTLKKGDSYQIKVTNVNLNNYKVTILNKDSIIASNVDSFPVFDLATLCGIGDLLSKIDINTISTFFKNSTQELTEFNRKVMAGKEDSISNDNFDWLKNYLLTTKEKDETEKIKTIIESRIKKEKKELEKAYKLLREYNNEIEGISTEFQYEYLKFRINNNNEFENELNEANKNFKISETIKDITKLRKEIKSLSEKISNQKLEYIEFISGEKFSKIMKLDDFKEADKNLQSAFERTTKDADTVLQSINYEKISSWLITYIDFINNKNNNEYFSAEQRISEDIVKTTITFTPIPENSKLDAFSAKWDFPKKSKIFIGLSMSFYYANLKDEIYSTKATVIDSETTQYSLVNEENKKGEMGVVSLIHLGWKISEDRFRNFGVSLVTGPALSLTKEIKPRISVGGGITYGEKNMFTLNALYMGGYVKKLSNAYNTNDVYYDEPKPTISKLDGSLAFSLGYIHTF